MPRPSSPPPEDPSTSELEEAFDRALAEIERRERAGEPVVPPEPMPPDVAEAVAALKEIFEGEHHLTADLSFDQVYAKALPHFVTIWKHVMGKQGAREED